MSLKDDNELARILGQCTLAWTACHTEVFLMFVLVTKMDTEVARSVFFALRADNSQRDITLAAIRSCKAKAKIKAAAEKLFDTLRKNSNERNAAIHQMWSRTHDGIIIPHPDVPVHDGLKTPDDYANAFGQLHLRLHNLYPRLNELRVSLQKETL